MLLCDRAVSFFLGLVSIVSGRMRASDPNPPSELHQYLQTFVYWSSAQPRALRCAAESPSFAKALSNAGQPASHISRAVVGRSNNVARFPRHSPRRLSIGRSAKKGFIAVKTIISPNNFPIALAISCVLFFSAAAAPQEQEWLSYYPAVARLQGKLTKISKFGKPTYGENPERDEKVEVPVLILQTPVRVKARLASSVNNESVTNVSFVQLIFPPEVDGNYSKHLDKEIVVAGTLVRGHKGEHFTDVVMTVKAVNPTGKPM